MSITPYINASIILQLLTVAIPALERMAKDGGEEGRKKISKLDPLLSPLSLACSRVCSYYALLRNDVGQDYAVPKHLQRLRRAVTRSS